VRSYGDTGTGVLFKEQTVPALVAAVEQFEVSQNLFNYEYIKLHAAQFSRQVFVQQYQEFLNKCKEKRPFLE
jgi:ASC-1-like (ASCH) protein